jgi:endonuclease-3 related protein
MIRIGDLYERLLAAYGPQHWWPAEKPFEIMAGALLVQRSTWTSTEASLAALKKRGLMTPQAMAAADLQAIEACIQGSGFFRSKAARLKRLAKFLTGSWSVRRMRATPTPMLRKTLLGLDGVGPETADAILLYAFGRPAVIVDEYLRRLTQRLTADPEPPTDAAIRRWVEAEIFDAPRLNELHALVVAHGKNVCGKTPQCSECEIRTLCLTGKGASDS